MLTELCRSSFCASFLRVERLVPNPDGVVEAGAARSRGGGSSGHKEPMCIVPEGEMGAKVTRDSVLIGLGSFRWASLALRINISVGLLGSADMFLQFWGGEQ